MKVSVSLSLEEDTVERLKDAARVSRRSRSFVAQEILERALEGREPQEGSPLIADASASPSALIGGPSRPSNTRVRDVAPPFEPSFKPFKPDFKKKP